MRLALRFAHGRRVEKCELIRVDRARNAFVMAGVDPVREHGIA